MHILGNIRQQRKQTKRANHAQSLRITQTLAHIGEHFARLVRGVLLLKRTRQTRLAFAKTHRRLAYALGMGKRFLPSIVAHRISEHTPKQTDVF